MNRVNGKKLRIVESQTPTQRRMRPFLEAIQEQLSPEEYESVLAINTETGEFVLGEDWVDAYRKFRERFPNAGQYICRADGSASIRM